MRASIEKLVRTLGSVGKPKHISQQPFDYDASHYERLCECGDRPNVVDLIDYALDMTYMKLQPELLRHLFPLLLRSWQKDIVAGTYGGFVEYFWPALLKGTALSKTLTPREVTGVQEFIQLALLDRIDHETDLHFASLQASPYAWIGALNAFATVFPGVEAFFAEWWKLDTCGHAVAVLQYASPLIYDDWENPIFDPWTSDRGGGPPCLWENGCHIYDAGWHDENLRFLRRWMTADRVTEMVTRSAVRLRVTPLAAKAALIAEDVLICRAVVERRLGQLPSFFAEPNGSYAFDAETFR